MTSAPARPIVVYTSLAVTCTHPRKRSSNIAMGVACFTLVHCASRLEAPVIGQQPQVPPQCTPQLLPSTGELAINLAMSRVRGMVTFRGGPLPEGEGVPVEGRGSLLFFEHRRGASAVLSLSNEGPGNFDIPLAQGEYSISYAPPQLVGPRPSTLVPLAHSVLLGRLVVGGETITNVDLNPVQLSAQIAVNGVAFPPLGEGSRWFARLRTETGRESIVPLDPLHPESATLSVLPGRYRLSLHLTPCVGLPEGVPCGNNLYDEEIVMDRDQSRTINMATARVSVGITINGMPPAEQMNPLEVAFVRAGSTEESVVATVRTTASDTFVTSIPYGTYDVRWRRPARSCAAAVGAQVPCLGGTVLSGLVINADRDLVIDVQPRKVAGKVFLGEFQLSAALSWIGVAVLRSSTGERAEVSLANVDGGLQYSAAVLPGKYQLIWSPSALTCTPLANPAFVPCAEFLVTSELEVREDVARDIHLAPVPLVIEQSGSGAPLAASQLWARGEGPVRRFRPFSAEPTVPFLVQEGTYSFAFDDGMPGCQPPGPMSSTLCTDGILAEGVRVMRDRPVELRIQSQLLRGSVTLNGAQLESLPLARRGHLRLLSSVGETAIELASTGPSEFAATVLPQRYLGYYQGPPGACRVGIPAVTSCGTNWVFGCDP